MRQETEPPKAGCYCRISSDPDDKREGVDRQREDTTALCEIKGWTPAGFYIDNDRSASNGKDRPRWDDLLADIKAGKIDAIAAWDQDRGWRMMAELEDLRKFFTGLGRKVPLATTGQGDIDLYSPAGVLTVQMKTAFSEHEIAMMKVRMRRAARQKAERGLPQWKRAFGYLPDTRPKEADDGKRQPDPVVAPLVVQAYAAIVAGGSLGDVCKLFNDAGAFSERVLRVKDEKGRPTGEITISRQRWTPPLVSDFLRKPRNAGLREHNDEIVLDEDGRPVKGTWAPLVEEDTWRAAQHVLNQPRRGAGSRKSVRRHLLTGMLVCGRCGGPLGGQWTTKKQIRYACTVCHGVTIRADDVEPIVYGIVSGRLAMPDAVDLLKAELHDTAEAEALRAEENNLLAELHNIGVERGRRQLTGEQAKVATDIVNAELQTVRRKQQDQERLRVFDGIPLGTPEAAAAVRKLSPDRFRAVLDVLMTVTVEPVGRGYGRVFDPERVQVDWR